MPKGIDVDISEGDDADDTAGKCMTCGGELDTNDEGHPECSKCRSKNNPQHLSDFLDETFARHKALLKKKLDEGKHKAGCQCGFCKNKGKITEKVKKPTEESKTEECKDCGCGKPNTEHDKDTKPLNEGLVRLSEAFERMRGLANLGERRVMANGLWGEGKAGVGANEPFQTKWKMDPEKAGMVKIDEAKLNTLMERLSKKASLTEKEQKLMEMAKNRKQCDSKPQICRKCGKAVIHPGLDSDGVCSSCPSKNDNEYTRTSKKFHAKHPVKNFSVDQ